MKGRDCLDLALNIHELCKLSLVGRSVKRTDSIHRTQAINEAPHAKEGVNVLYQGQCVGAVVDFSMSQTLP